MKKVLILHGPDLNLLRSREPAVYGKHTLAEIDAKLRKIAEDAGATLPTFQSNADGALIDRVHEGAKEQTG